MTVIAAALLVVFVVVLLVAFMGALMGEPSIDWDDMDRHYEGPDR